MKSFVRGFQESSEGNMHTVFQKMDENDLIQNAQAGDGEAVSYLLEKYKGSVRALSRPLFLMDGDQDDLIQEGMIGLFKAIQNYDRERGASFETFANVCISKQLYTAIEKSNRKKNIPLNSYISIYSDEYLNGEGDLEHGFLSGEIFSVWEKNPEDIVIKKESRENVLESLYEALSNMEKRVLDLFLKGLTYQEIAKRLDYPPKTIDNALQRIKMKMQKIRKK